MEEVCATVINDFQPQAMETLKLSSQIDSLLGTMTVKTQSFAAEQQ